MSLVRILIGGFCACAVSLGLGRFAYTPILPLMGIDTESAGWLAASNNLGYLIGAVWASWASSENQRHRLLNFGLALVAVSLAAMALTGDQMIWNLIRLIAGIGSALVFVLGSALVVPRLAEMGRAKLSGLHFGGVGLGIFASGSAIAWIGGRTTDSGAWWAAGIICAVLSATSYLCLRSLRAPKPADFTPRPPSTAIPFPLPLLAAAYFCAGFGYIITGTFLVVVVKSTPGLGEWANLSWVLVGVAAIPSAAAWGWVAEHKGYAPALAAAHILMALGTALLALFGHPLAVFAAAVLYGGTFLGIAGMAVAFGRAITPAHPARTMGVLTVFFSIGQIIGPVVAAKLAESGGWMPALLVAAAVTIAGAPLLTWGEIKSARSLRHQKAPVRSFPG
ncbi:YbfB/YjiJ family MFS transporter [Magnetospirillum sulfuroxidans]|uniref:YbfB/YjiJ family MFS transporter n=1 Tax=Magnetospirillum sulfuroxidans TaxID=611300 RepID=A0ABS5IBX5_9PROT|nr:YbfB/YjiJ family MFS transporter [Magnetospirillum sulfuroxidans]MBR9971920.1 YbfB/YjiJ family MFS transporter [Magnetospirillum sulfuroxidans]